MRTLFPVFLLLGGCVEASEFIPKVKFDRMQVNALSFQDISTDFVFTVDNPNPIKVGVAEFAYDFELEQISLFEGDNSDGFKLEPEGVSELSLPIDLIFAETWETIQATKGQDEVDFRVAGRFGFDTPIGPVKVPYDEDGAFPAVRTPKFNFKNLRVGQVDLTGATLELDLGVTNEHGSDLIFDNFAYAVKMEGHQVGSGLVQTFDVLGADEGTLTIPFAVSFFDFGAAVIDAIVSGGPVKMGLGAAVDVDTPFGVIPLTVDESGNVAIPAR